MLLMLVTKLMLPGVVTIYTLFIVTAKGNKAWMVTFLLSINFNAMLPVFCASAPLLFLLVCLEISKMYNELKPNWMFFVILLLPQAVTVLNC